MDLTGRTVSAVGPSCCCLKTQLATGDKLLRNPRRLGSSPVGPFEGRRAGSMLSEWEREPACDVGEEATRPEPRSMQAKQFHQ